MPSTTSPTEDPPTSTRVTRRPAEGLDDVDRAIVARLQQDGRENNRSIAAALGANEVTIANRLKRLEENAIMRVVALADMQSFGQRDLVFLLVRVVGRPVFEVAAELCDMPEAMGVTITTGRWDLVVTVLARDHAHVSQVLTGTLGHVKGIDVVRSELSLEVLKYESKWAKLEPGDDLTLRLEPFGDLDDLDVAIVEKLQVDARLSNRRIAASLGVVEGTVRSRLRRMHADGVIQIQAICDVLAFGVGAHAYVGLETQAGSADAVAQSLVGLDQVAVLARSLGEFDLIAVVHASDRQGLINVVLNDIATIEGVRHTETMESFATLKHLATWARILPPGT